MQVKHVYLFYVKLAPLTCGPLADDRKSLPDDCRMCLNLLTSTHLLRASSRMLNQTISFAYFLCLITLTQGSTAKIYFFF